MKHDVFVQLGKWYLLFAASKALAFGTIGIVVGGGNPTAHKVILAYSLLILAFIVIDSLWFLAPRMIFHHRLLEHESGYFEKLSNMIDEQGWYWIFRNDWISETYRSAAANNDKLD